ncbi:MAG TPA: NAD(P)/FAD-dependent oxidoreductase [Leptospiraceae bacterium]|nr:NAD(P)/FAD-dependent oxidoreductase [Leptospiraceae bacterium]
MENKYDVIVIGSGIGGMTTAAILSRLAKKKVLVLEQHFELGGQTHEFRRKGKFSWDVGLHYVSMMEEDSVGKKVFDYITKGQVKWNHLPYEFEKFIYPDFTFTVPSNEEEYTKKLCAEFPEDSVSIKKYFQDMRKAMKWAEGEMISKLVPSFIGFFVRLWNKKNEGIALCTTKQYLDANFKNERLKALLVSHWGDYGLPPGKSSFLIHSIVTVHYLKGASYPEGGAGTIARAAEKIIEEAGGKCLLNAEVKGIIVRNGKAAGVDVQHKRGDKTREIVEAPIVISSTGAYHTYTELLKDYAPASYINTIKSFSKGNSAVTLFIGLNKDPSLLGFKGENNWIYESYDHDALADRTEKALDGKAEFCYLSFPSLKNTQAKAHTAEIISFIKYDLFKIWESSRWKKRGMEYDHLKERIADGLLDLVEKHYPGFKDMVEYTELSTPLTYLDLGGRPRGEFYGLPAVPEKYRIKWLGPKTPLKNFYMSGSDVMSLGIMGAMMGGVAAAACVLEPAGFPKIMKAVDRK